MRYVFLTLAIASSGSAMAADSLSDSNLVQRALTLKNNEVLLGAGLSYGKNDVDEEVGLGLAARYGLTDNLSIGLGGISYRFIQRQEKQTGLEMAFNVGLKGRYESQVNGDSLGYGASAYGKYVLTSDTAVNFAASYIFWNEEYLNNKKEWQYLIGITQNLTQTLALNANYTYRDLSGFTQHSAMDVGVGLNYALTDQLDIGIHYSYSDFNAQKNQYDADTAMEKNLGAYITYRF